MSIQPGLKTGPTMLPCLSMPNCLDKSCSAVKHGRTRELTVKSSRRLCDAEKMQHSACADLFGVVLFFQFSFSSIPFTKTSAHDFGSPWAISYWDMNTFRELLGEPPMLGFQVSFPERKHHKNTDCITTICNCQDES